MQNVKITTLSRDTRKLYSKSIGILFVYAICFFCLSSVFFAVSRKLWSLSLLTVKEGYISDHNFTDFFTHPLVLLTGICSLAGFCILSLLESTGMIMLLEYLHEGKSVRFFSIFPASFRQIIHCLHPKNWMIFVYLLLIQPLVDSNFSGNMLSSITIPEFIMDFIMSKWALSLLTVLIYGIAVFFFIRFLFLPYIMILEKKSFREASRKSALFLKGHFISTYMRLIIATIIGTILVLAVPLLLLFVIQAVMAYLFRSYPFVKEVGTFVFTDLLPQLLNIMNAVFIKIFVASLLLVLYHDFETQLGSETPIQLPENCIKQTGRIYSFKGFFYGTYCVLFGAAALLFAVLTFASKYDTSIIESLVTPTQIAAHKGYSSQAPENTMPAFTLAADCPKVDYIELDIRETKDGIPVVIHNANLQTAAGMSESVYDLTFAQLQEIAAPYGFSEEAFPGVTVPSLEQVLETYAGKTDFIIEIKASPLAPELPEKIVALMEKYGITKTSMIHSGDYESLKAVKARNPDIACGFIIAISTGGYADLPFADFFSVEHTCISEDMIDQIHNRGKKVFVWTVNEAESIKQVRFMDADVLITDYPEIAYDGIHQYEPDLMHLIRSGLIKTDLPDTVEAVDYQGTGD